MVNLTTPPYGMLPDWQVLPTWRDHTRGLQHRSIVIVKQNLVTDHSVPTFAHFSFPLSTSNVPSLPLPSLVFAGMNPHFAVGLHGALSNVFGGSFVGNLLTAVYVKNSVLFHVVIFGEAQFGFTSDLPLAPLPSRTALMVTLC